MLPYLVARKREDRCEHAHEDFEHVHENGLRGAAARGIRSLGIQAVFRDVEVYARELVDEVIAFTVNHVVLVLVVCLFHRLNKRIGLRHHVLVNRLEIIPRSDGL